eukprot:999759-Prorocentrum_minimum.AAC.1
MYTSGGRNLQNWGVVEGAQTVRNVGPQFGGSVRIKYRSQYVMSGVAETSRPTANAAGDFS